MTKPRSAGAPMSDEKLPDHLRPYFWEVDFGRLRVAGRERYIVERLLEYGNDRAIRWLRATFASATIADAVRHSRRLSPRTATFWALISDIPRSEIQCFSTHSPQMPRPF